MAGVAVAVLAGAVAGAAGVGWAAGVAQEHPQEVTVAGWAEVAGVIVSFII